MVEQAIINKFYHVISTNSSFEVVMKNEEVGVKH